MDTQNNIQNSYIRELRGGSHKAFNIIYDMYADKLYSFALAHSKSKDSAKDIVQDTFLKLWTMRESLTLDGSLQSLLFTIANRRMIDMFRKQINKTEMELYIAYREGSSEENNPEIESKLLFDDFIKTLRLCKRLLTSRQLEIYELSREKGKSISEISNMINLSEQTIKNQLTIALKKIKEELLKANVLYLIIFEICCII